MSSKRKCCVLGQCDSVSLGASSLTAPGRLHFLGTHPWSKHHAVAPHSPVSCLPFAHGLRVEDSQVAESWFHGLVLSPVFSASINTYFESAFSVNTFVVSVLIKL